MAKHLTFQYTFEGLDDLRADIQRAADIDANTRKKMVSAAGEVYQAEVKKRADAMLNGKYSKFQVGKSAKMMKPRVTKDGANQRINFTGKQHGNRMAEIAFVNHYGTKKQPARPFLDIAQKEADLGCVNAAAKVLDNFLKKNSL